MKTFLTIIIVLLIAFAINLFVTGIKGRDTYYLLCAIISMNVASFFATVREEI